MADKCLSQIMMEAEVLPGELVGFVMSSGVLLHTPTYRYHDVTSGIHGPHVSAAKDFG